LLLNEDSDLPLNGTSLSVLGMGITEQDETLTTGPIPPRLMDTTINVLDRDSCAALMKAHEVNHLEQGENFTLFDFDDKSMICTIYLNDKGSIEGGQDACFGDGGGPVVYIEEDGNHILMGVVSWGDDICGVSYFPDVIAV
jgi:secreted trypsin-like serine protease